MRDGLMEQVTSRMVCGGGGVLTGTAGAGHEGQSCWFEPQAGPRSRCVGVCSAGLDRDTLSSGRQEMGRAGEALGTQDTARENVQNAFLSWIRMTASKGRLVTQSETKEGYGTWHCASPGDSLELRSEGG